MWSHLLESARCDFFRCRSLFSLSRKIQNGQQLRPVLKAAVDAEALKRGASREEVSRLHDELARGAPVLERLIADGLAGRFPAEEVDIQNWREMLKRAQDLQLKLRKRLNQRAARTPAMAEERQEESSMEALREKREALRQRRIRTPARPDRSRPTPRRASRAHRLQSSR